MNIIRYFVDSILHSDHLYIDCMSTIIKLFHLKNTQFSVCYILSSYCSFSIFQCTIPHNATLDRYWPQCQRSVKFLSYFFYRYTSISINRGLLCICKQALLRTFLLMHRWFLKGLCWWRVRFFMCRYFTAP